MGERTNKKLSFCRREKLETLHKRSANKEPETKHGGRRNLKPGPNGPTEKNSNITFQRKKSITHFAYWWREEYLFTYWQTKIFYVLLQLHGLFAV
jgi:hypothetical protein